MQRINDYLQEVIPVFIKDLKTGEDVFKYADKNKLVLLAGQYGTGGKPLGKKLLDAGAEMKGLGGIVLLKKGGRAGLYGLIINPVGLGIKEVLESTMINEFIHDNSFKKFKFNKENHVGMGAYFKTPLNDKEQVEKITRLYNNLLVEYREFRKDYEDDFQQVLIRLLLKIKE
ncbi:hypothetical protein GF352_02355 [archaeon]|nr:hypothetical protein [archaeon]